MKKLGARRKSADKEGLPPDPPKMGDAGAARPQSSSEDARSLRPQSNSEDALSFHLLMSGVTPLSEKAARVPVAVAARVTRTNPSAEQLQEAARAEAAEALEHLHRLVDDAARFEVSDDGHHVEGRRIDIPTAFLRSLRRGVVPVDGRLDLHGLSAAQAKDKLHEFLRTMRTRGEKCVLVIHGKGERVPGGGVMRGEIAAWLSQGRSREHVAAFASAVQSDGGEGAVYVALRR